MTIIPVPGLKHADLNEAGRSAVFFPVVGLFIGAVLCGAAYLGGLLWSAAVVSAVVTALWVIITAGMHIDGLADLADGVGGGWDVESRLRIMKDSSIGTYGALAVGILLMLKAVFIYESLTKYNILPVLLLVPAAARGVQVISIRIFRPAKTEGFGAVFKNGVNTFDAVTAAVFSVAMLTAVWGLQGTAVFGLSVLFMLAAGWWISRRLGGLNGDSYGAVCELSEAFLLITVTVIRPGLNGPLGFIFR